MPEAKTEIVSLNTGSFPWDSPYNISPILINMVTDSNGRLLSIPVNKTLHTFLDYSFDPASENVTILAIMRASKSRGTYNDDLRINQFVSDFAVITTGYLPSTWTPEMGLCTITVFKINELNHNVLALLPLTNTDDGEPLLNPNFMNRGDFSYAQNSSDQCAFIDDDALVWYFEVSSSVTEGAKKLSYYGAGFLYLVDDMWGILGEVGSDEVNSLTDGIKETDITGTINYRTLFDVIPGNTQLIVVLQNYGIVYTADQNLFYFTEAGDFSKILFEFDKWPQYNGSATLPYNPALWETGDGRLGTPLTYRAPGRVVDIVGINSSMFVFTQDSIYRYNLTIVNSNPTLQPDTTFNMNYKIRLNSNAVVYQNAMYFVTEDDKIYALTTKGIITELTNRLLPDKYNFIYNKFYINDTVQNFYPSRILLPIKLFNKNCLIENYTVFDLDTGNFSFLIANKNLTVEWESIFGDCTYDQPKRITASNDTGRLIGLQNEFQYVPTDFDNSISDSEVNFDYFSDGLYISKPYKFEGKDKGKLAGINISFTDSNFDPALFQDFEAITLGLYIIVDNSYSFELIENMRDDDWWIPYNKTFNRKYSNNIYPIKLNISCQSFIVCVRFSKFNPVLSIDPKFELQKFSVDNIMLNLFI
jgi:hypothetical protein